VEPGEDVNWHRSEQHDTATGMMHPEPLLQIGAGEASASGSYALSTNRATLANLTNMPS
jgi:hypothetical protein